ncbi:hypothetical protein MNEG_9848, partial [Monoraphidium neglectum]
MVRFRRLKPQYASAADDRAAKLRLFDFPLNPQPGAACRAIELPSGKQHPAPAAPQAAPPAGAPALPPLQLYHGPGVGAMRFPHADAAPEESAEQPQGGAAAGLAVQAGRKRSRKPPHTSSTAAAPERPPPAPSAPERPLPLGFTQSRVLPGVQPRKRRKLLRGNAARGRFAALKGVQVRIPSEVLNVEDAEDLLFNAVVVGRDNTHAGCLTVRFKHWKERFFFPLEQIEEWIIEHADADPDRVKEFASWPSNEASRNRVVRTNYGPAISDDTAVADRLAEAARETDEFANVRRRGALKKVRVPAQGPAAGGGGGYGFEEEGWSGGEEGAGLEEEGYGYADTPAEGSGADGDSDGGSEAEEEEDGEEPDLTA